MATQTGKRGVIKLGATPVVVAETRQWSLEQSADPVEHSVIGDTYRKYQSSMIGYTVSLEGYYDTADSGQAEIVFDTPVDFELFPAGETSGEKQYSGTAYVTAFTETAAFDGMVEFTATLQGTGDLVETTVV